MASPVSGRSPIDFFSEGTQYVIPLSGITLNDKNEPVVDTKALPPGFVPMAALVDWLKHLVERGELRATPTATLPVGPVFFFEAAEPGAAANSLSVEITKVAEKLADTATDTVVTIKALAVNTWSGLLPKDVRAVLGTRARSGLRPGLVVVADSTPALPAPAAGTKSLAGDDQSASFGDLKLQSARKDPVALGISVEVKLSELANGTFEVIATLELAAADVKLGEVDGKLGYLVRLRPPEGGITGLPRLGRVVLNGGADAARAQAGVFPKP